MKKRLIAALLAGAVAVSGVIGLSACGVSVPAGEEVTKSVWKNAFDKATELTNYTMNNSGNVSATVKGTVSHKDYSTNKVTKEDIEVTAKMAEDITILYDRNHNYYYSEYSGTQDMKYVDDGGTRTQNSKLIQKRYYEFSENDKSTSTEYFWRANYSLSGTERDDRRDLTESYWQADETSSFPDNELDQGFISQLFYNSADEEKQESGYLTEIYDWFTYSGGKYTATLYISYSLPEISVSEYIACDVSVSIKNGCAVGASIKIDTKGTTYAKEQYDLAYTVKGETVYALSNLGNTDPSKKATGDVARALEKAKADKAKNS